MIETIKAWGRVAFVIGMMISTYVLVTPGEQTIMAWIGGGLATLGVILGWWDFKETR